jgi:prepilin signal peptidase PulO-like enzyme (type II secretory pathway)
MFSLAPGQPVAAAAVIVIGLTVIAAIDVATHKIHGLSTLGLGVSAAIVLAVVDRVQPEQWLSAGIAGVLAFVLYLEFAVMSADRVFGGSAVGAGDIKLIGIPAAVFGASSLVLAVTVLYLGVAIQTVLARGRGNTTSTPHGPALAIAALAGFTWLTQGGGAVA